jgi:hypothetical protein
VERNLRIAHPSNAADEEAGFGFLGGQVFIATGSERDSSRSRCHGGGQMASAAVVTHKGIFDCLESHLLRILKSTNYCQYLCIHRLDIAESK